MVKKRQAGSYGIHPSYVATLQNVFCEDHKFQAGDASGVRAQHLNRVLRLPWGLHPAPSNPSPSASFTGSKLVIGDGTGPEFEEDKRIYTGNLDSQLDYTNPKSGNSTPGRRSLWNHGTNNIFINVERIGCNVDEN